MRITDFCRYVLGFCAALALLAGCGNVSPVATRAVGSFQQSSAQSWFGQLSEIPAGTTSAVQGSAIVVHPNHARSWMEPDAKIKDLLYVTNRGYNDVLVYSYPQDKLVGTLTGNLLFPDGVCTDKKGDVWIVKTWRSRSSNLSMAARRQSRP